MVSAVLFVLVLQVPKLDIPNTGWVDIYFGQEADAQSIRGRSQVSGLPNLQRKAVPSGVTEIRVWQGFGLTYLEGYRFRHENGKWRGWWIPPLAPNKKPMKAANFLLDLKAPKVGWDSFWKRLDENGILTLPDFESLPGPKQTIHDGVSYVVEVARSGAYRTYMYDNPNDQPDRWTELGKLKAIVKLIHDSFRDQTVR